MDESKAGEAQYKGAKPSARKFVDLVASGQTHDRAHKAAGYTGESEDCGHVMANHYRPAIQWKIRQLRRDSEAAKLAHESRLTNIAQASLGRILPDGSLEFGDEDWERLSPEDKATLNEVIIETTTREDEITRRVKLKLEPRLQAEAQLAKLNAWPEQSKDSAALLEELANYRAIAARAVAIRDGEEDPGA